jgi:hypothetical protein
MTRPRIDYDALAQVLEEAADRLDRETRTAAPKDRRSNPEHSESPPERSHAA